MVEWTSWQAVLCLLLGVGGIGRESVAQQPCWRIPEAGAVEYRRDWQATASDVCRASGVARKAALTASLPARYLHHLAPAPFLCQGELRPDKRAVVGPVADLRDVLRSMAFDYSRGTAECRFPRLLPYGDVRVRGAWTRADADGKQELRARVEAKLPVKRRREPKEVASRLSALCVLDTVGTLRISRTFDPALGVVAQYRGHLDLVVREEKRGYRRLYVSDAWQLVAVRENQDRDFRKRVAAAVRRGTAWIENAVASDASYLQNRRGRRDYGSGRLALSLLALIHGQRSRESSVIRAGFAALRRRRLEDAYSLATGLMAMAARHRQVPISVRDREICEKWLSKLLTCTDTRTKTTEVLRFNYTRGARTDTSLQQYGLLGLRAAQKMGVELPASCFAAAALQLLEVQASNGDPIRLEWMDHDQLMDVLGTSRIPNQHTRRVRARGFAYQDADHPAFGSMTSAGLSGMLLARAGLQEQATSSRGLLRRLDGAIHDGFGWLGGNLSLRINPGFAERADNHWTYWLYCLERCCELFEVTRLQGRDWYYEGALQLLAAQNPDGSFRGGHASTLRIDSTCFAILFLSKASAIAPITGR
jgi:hypothetical protein